MSEPTAATRNISLSGPDFIDTAAFALPPNVARAEAVRKLAARLTRDTGIGEMAADTIAQAVVDPAAVRAALDEGLPGLTALPEAHLRVIPTRVWTPWVTPPGDDITRYSSLKRLPFTDPAIPPTPRPTETADGFEMQWESPAARAWHLKDNEELYSGDIHTDRLRIFPEKGGVAVPLVLTPQTETFSDGSNPLHLLRIGDGRMRYYEALSYLRQFAQLDQDSLTAHLGLGITPDDVAAALQRDRSALLKVVRAIRNACTAADDSTRFQTGAHYLATTISLPAYIVIGTTDSATSEVHPLGSHCGYPIGTRYALESAVTSWHSKGPARVISTGQQQYNGLLLPEAYVDTTLIETAPRRLRARGVSKEVVTFGTNISTTRFAARFVWWCRAVQQLGGTPATAVAGFALNTEGPWPQAISRSILACASHLMEEDRDTLYPPGDYRDFEARPDSLTLLVADALNLEPVASLSAADNKGGVLAHPRFRNAEHIALAHLALSGALPAQEPLPERITTHVQLMSSVALRWARTQAMHFITPTGEVHRDNEGRPVAIDERTLSRNDLPWPKRSPNVRYATVPPTEHRYAATHVFTLKHDVVYTIPDGPLREEEIEATPEALAKVVRRWFPDATGITLTDWSDKYITGVMVGSVWVRLDDRQAEREYGRSEGTWYPEGHPGGTKDVLDFDDPTCGLPVGHLVSAGDFLDWTDDGTTNLGFAEDAVRAELTDAILTEVDEALEGQKAADKQAVDERWTVPVLRLPENKRAR